MDQEMLKPKPSDENQSKAAQLKAEYEKIKAEPIPIPQTRIVKLKAQAPCLCGDRNGYEYEVYREVPYNSIYKDGDRLVGGIRRGDRLGEIWND